ncbi:hypothetical protein WV31_13235 [Magnetospirillum sp. ME-1]|uniref:hypothetical protein n=1 Tax=Magnetospirillum sp. ME-1 TaxID=1639348 RepID=UPI000A17BB80|nr:hypothetical protein [Magnetospirillum sp. ME-1]ARJ66563.1 hypothetical protein WV31_13235 [Magnetospirillum sp. ME-1]
MSALLLCLAAFFGLGGWLPSPVAGRLWLGGRFFAGWALMETGIYLLHFVAQMPLGLSARAMAVVGLAGLVPLLRRRPPPAALLHPAVLMPLAAALILAVRGGLTYEPLAWDELSNWAAWARSATLADRLVGPEVRHGLAGFGYTPGWALSLAFPGLVFGGFDEARAAVIPFLMHVGLLGLLFDAVEHMLSVRGVDERRSRIMAAALMLLALAAEATWRLAPTNLLIEKPQIFAMAGCLLLGLTAVTGGTRPRLLALHLGVLFAAAYLVKVSCLGLGGSLAILMAGALWAERRLGWRHLAVEGGLRALLVLGPVLVCYGVWRLVFSEPGCLGNPVQVFTEVVAGPLPQGADELFRRFFGAVLAYVGAYKLPLTVLSLAGLAACLHDRRGVLIVLALVGFIAPYFLALYAYHLSCFSGYYWQELNSIDRFTRVPLRLVHLFGLTLPVVVWGPVLARRPWPGALRPVILAGLSGLALLAGWRLSQDFRAMATRFNESAEQVETVRTMRTQTEAVLRLAVERPGLGANVQMLAQGTQGYERLIADYFAAGRLVIPHRWSFAPEQRDAWTFIEDEAGMRRRLAEASLVWVVRLDPWMSSVLAPLVDGLCLRESGGYLLVPVAGDRLRCTPLAG